MNQLRIRSWRFRANSPPQLFLWSWRLSIAYIFPSDGRTPVGSLTIGCLNGTVSTLRAIARLQAAFELPQETGRDRL